MPAGKEWAELNGDVKLITSYAWEGRVYPKSLYAQATSSFTYALGGEYRLFAAAAGVGNASGDTSVEFVVNVDGKEAYRSPVYHAGEPVLPVTVDVTGAAELDLVVTDGGDGIRNDYAWWGGSTTDPEVTPWSPAESSMYSSEGCGTSDALCTLGAT